MKRIINIILGSLIIGVAYNVFFMPYKLVSSGLIGLGTLFTHAYGYNAAIFIAICNIVLLILCLPVLGRHATQKYLLPSFLIPSFIFLTKDLSSLVHFESIELIIISISGAFLTGYGYSLINKEGYSVGGFELVSEIFNKTKISENKYIPYTIELVIIILTIISLGLEYGIYTVIIITIILYISTKSKIGISSNKTFFIITTKENEVKDYLINDLNYDYTEFNVKGGFTNQKNKIIMTVIDTKDYYRLKEGISIIDENAFISIIDNYESINKNVALKNKHKTLQK